MTRGDVCWYTFRPPDKRRPVLILTRESVISHLNEVTIAPITTRIRNIPSEVSLGPADGVPRGCAINFDHLQTIVKSKIGTLITHLSRERMAQARKALLFALDFEE